MVHLPDTVVGSETVAQMDRAKHFGVTGHVRSVFASEVTTSASGGNDRSGHGGDDDSGLSTALDAGEAGAGHSVAR
jgi:hypothetical protein